ncbi:MAG: S41 family peptidase [Bacteroidaceae bacterium]|nr:S41 family peptidase [Bacteroidaceae bacterium]
MPLLLAVAVVIGIVIGTFYTSHFSGKRLNIINTGSNKLNYLLQIIDNNYVDTVNTQELIESAMPQILSELDPHSSYISSDQAEESTEELKGSFSGIGVRFALQDDTVNVISTIKRGPAEKVGILAGDRIIAADDSTLIGLPNHDIIKKLRGPKHSKVRLTVVRPGRKNNGSKDDGTLKFTVDRDDVPVESVEAAFMLSDNTGYLAIESFGETTYPQMLAALAELSAHNLQNLIIDLRGNRGGYMQTAILIANEFLPSGQLILYTEGRKSPRQEFNADGHGSFQKIPLVVLVDEVSASASEIFAGAVQDNDRGTIIGRRTFGKGLVQQPIEFKDHSIVRLTIARYYTPSGRSIQKPYQKGRGEEYENELIQRYERGEFFSQDSIQHSGPEFKTRLGRTVYGGGGIVPDIFVPEDTTLYTSYFKEAIYMGLTIQFAMTYADRNRQQLQQFKTPQQIAQYLKQQNIVEQFAQFADEHGLKRRNRMIQHSAPLLERNLTANIIYNTQEQEWRMQYLSAFDPAVQKALEIFHQGAAFPQKPNVK